MASFSLMALCVLIGAGLGTLFHITHSSCKYRTKWIVLGLYVATWFIDKPLNTEGTIGLVMQTFLCIYYVFDYQYLSRM
jgi:hypothetical protein